MDEAVKRKLEELGKKAKEGGIKSKPTLRNRSSLHKIIKNKETGRYVYEAAKVRLAQS